MNDWVTAAFESRAPWNLTLLTGVAWSSCLATWVSLIFLKKFSSVTWHQKIQKFNAAVLLVAVLVFEYHARTVGWKQFAYDSPYFDTLVIPSLVLHLFFAGACFFIWSILVFTGLKMTDRKQLRLTHRKLGKYGAFAITGTALSGTLFYYLAFVATIEL